MLRQYENVIIITPLLTEEQMQEVVEKFRTFLKNNKVEIFNEENWGLRKLAYSIKKKSTGFYHMFEFKASPEIIEKLETEYRRDERIMRFLTVALDKHGIEFSEKRIKGELGKIPGKNKKKEESINS
jgi:small subunit ribosomal protein S6